MHVCLFSFCECPTSAKWKQMSNFDPIELLISPCGRQPAHHIFTCTLPKPGAFGTLKVHGYVWYQTVRNEVKIKMVPQNTRFLFIKLWFMSKNCQLLAVFIHFPKNYRAKVCHLWYQTKEKSILFWMRHANDLLCAPVKTTEHGVFSSEMLWRAVKTKWLLPLLLWLTRFSTFCRMF